GLRRRLREDHRGAGEERELKGAAPTKSSCHPDKAAPAADEGSAAASRLSHGQPIPNAMTASDQDAKHTRPERCKPQEPLTEAVQPRRQRPPGRVALFGRACCG